MKKLLFFSSLLFSFSLLKAQSLEEGKQHLYYERYNSAANTLKTVVQQDPKNEEAWYRLTEAYLQLDEVNQARESLQAVPEKLYKEPYYNVAMGAVRLEENKPAEAAAYFENALDKTKRKKPEILLAVAEAHIHAKNGDANYAISLLNRAIEREDKDPSLYVALGDAYRKLHNGSEAYKAYRDALQLNSAYATAYFKTGQIFLTQKNPDMYLDYFRKAVNADGTYAPALYKLYLYYFYYDPTKAMEYYNQYMAHADKGLQNQYDMADLYYLNKEYNKAIRQASDIVQQQGEKTKARLYKLIGYSYASLKDSAKAMQYMQQYFTNESDSNLVAKDYEILAKLYVANTAIDSAANAFVKASQMVEDSTEVYGYYKQIADLYGSQKDFANQAKWMGKYYQGNPRATNVDLFNWALTHYRAEEYALADSTFGLYVEKYPDQSYGYYWQARSSAALDTGMKQGLAVPRYQKLIEVLEKDSSDANSKRWLLEAYNYLAAYETNTEKDYEQAVGYFEKVLELDPQNTDAKKYKELLEKSLANSGSR